MSLLKKIRDGIINGDWELICSAYNKVTGENLSPPVTKEPEKVFDYKVAKKKELYEWLSERRDLNPISKYKLAELREMAEFYYLFGNEEAEEETVDNNQTVIESNPEPINQTPTNDSPFYFNESLLLESDKKLVKSKINPVPELGQFGSEGIPKDYQKTYREEYKLGRARCLICQAMSEVPIVRINMIGDGPTTTCDSCINKPRN